MYLTLFTHLPNLSLDVSTCLQVIFGESVEQSKINPILHKIHNP